MVVAGLSTELPASTIPDFMEVNERRQRAKEEAYFRLDFDVEHRNC